VAKSSRAPHMKKEAVASTRSPALNSSPKASGGAAATATRANAVTHFFIPSSAQTKIPGQYATQPRLRWPPGDAAQRGAQRRRAATKQPWSDLGSHAFGGGLT